MFQGDVRRFHQLSIGQRFTSEPVSGAPVWRKVSETEAECVESGCSQTKMGVRKPFASEAEVL